MLKYILLGFLSYRPMTGYEIDHWMSRSTGHFWHAKLSQIYTTLKTLEGEKLVVSHVEPQAERPDRRVYTLTPAGKAELDTWRAEILVERETKKDALLLKVFFAAPEEQDRLLTQLKVQLELHQQQKRQYEEETPSVVGAFLAEQPELLEHAKLWDLTRQYGAMYEEAYIRWLQAAIQFIQSQKS